MIFLKKDFQQYRKQREIRFNAAQECSGMLHEEARERREGREREKESSKEGERELFNFAGFSPSLSFSSLS